MNRREALMLGGCAVVIVTTTLLHKLERKRRYYSAGDDSFWKLRRHMDSPEGYPKVYVGGVEYQRVMVVDFDEGVVTYAPVASNGLVQIDPATGNSILKERVHGHVTMLWRPDLPLEG